jgi:DNA-binding MarR family transcriptional regulator
MLPPDPGLRLGPPLDLLVRLWALNHALERVSSHMASELGITAQQRLLLRCIGTYPTITAAQLAGLVHLDPSTVSSGLARLARRGLVDRRRHHLDARRFTLGLTPAGRALDQPSPATVEQAVVELLASTPAARLATAMEVIAELVQHLDGRLVAGRKAERRPVKGRRRARTSRRGG